MIFTDGVDWHSEQRSSDENRRAIEESGIIVYPIRYNTRDETERLAREQQRQGQSVDLGAIFGPGSQRTTTPTTFPGGSIPIPPGGTGPSGPLGIPLPPQIIIPRRDDRNRRDDPYPGQTNEPSQSSSGGIGSDSIDSMLDLAYATADGYLDDLAKISGGRLHRADTLGSLPAAFREIAAELRTQYSLAYYPTNTLGDGKFHKLKVRATRKGVVIRSRPGYRAQNKRK